MKKCFFLLLFLPSLFIACKKNTVNYSSFTLYQNGDSSWSTTNVSSILQTDTTVVITAINSSTDEKVIFNLSGYREGRKTYYIGYGSVPGNSYGSSASYQGVASFINGYEGEIVINSFAVHTMNGTFDFQSDTVHYTGSFKAPIP